MIHVYTGDGKGKTTAALGLALRAFGHGFRSVIIQFMKNPEMMGEIYGEIKAIKNIAPGIEIKSFGRAGWIKKGEASDEDKKLASDAVKTARDALKDNKIKLVILDEIFLALHFDLITLHDIIKILDSKPADKELVLTGRKAPQEIIDRADLVTEMRQVKHYFQKGIQARKGIEF